MMEEINIAVDEVLLQKATEVLAELGISVEDAAAAFINAIVQDRSILERMVEEEQDRLAYEAAMEEYRANPVSRPIEELWNELGLNTPEEDKPTEGEV